VPFVFGENPHREARRWVGHGTDTPRLWTLIVNDIGL
jgi:hypothetical protein